jgi:hypothetical protein
MNCHIIIYPYIDAYVDDDVDTTSAHLLSGQNIRYVNIWPTFSHFRSTFLAIWQPISATWQLKFSHQFLMHFSTHSYIAYNPGHV